MNTNIIPSIDKYTLSSSLDLKLVMRRCSRSTQPMRSLLIYIKLDDLSKKKLSWVKKIEKINLYL